MFRDEIQDILTGLYGSMGRSTEGLANRVDAAVQDWDGVPAGRMREAAIEWRRNNSKMPTNAELRAAAGYGSNKPVGGGEEYPPWKFMRNRALEIARRELMADKITREEYREIYALALSESGSGQLCTRYRDELQNGEPKPYSEQGERPTPKQHHAAIRLISGLSRGQYRSSAADYVGRIMKNEIDPDEVIALCDKADLKYAGGVESVA